MTVRLVTFSDDSMSRAREVCVKSAAHPGFEKHESKAFHEYTRSDVETLGSYQDNRALFDAPRGCGLWAWKPAIILDVMHRQSAFGGCVDGDVVVYADAGVEFIDNVSCVIDRMDQDVFLFGNMYEHAHWCKRDIVEAIWPLSVDKEAERKTIAAMETPDRIWGVDWGAFSWARFSKQVQASVIFFRVNDWTRALVKEWLDWCLFEGGRLIDDSPSRTPNHPEFQENRHDQAILTTLAYREGIKLHWWPASYNDGGFTYPKSEYTDDYPVLFNHHRRRNHEWKQVA